MDQNSTAKLLLQLAKCRIHPTIFLYELPNKNRNEEGTDCSGRTGKVVKMEGLIYKERLK